MWKWILFAWEWNKFLSMASLLASPWNRGQDSLRNVLSLVLNLKASHGCLSVLFSIWSIQFGKNDETKQNKMNITVQLSKLLKIFFFFFHVALSCPSLSNPGNGQVSLSSGLVMGSTATYTCNSGFKATFTSTRYCQADGQWSGGAPSCLR